MNPISCLLKRAVLLGASIALAANVSAQLKTPAASPHAVLEQTVGLTEVAVDYSRPSVKGREIFGGLVPYGKVWRTGANQPSKISFSDDVVLGGEKVPAGQYAFYTIPGKTEWTVIIYKSTDLWGSMGYDPKNDLVRFTVKPTKLAQPVESMTFSIDGLRNDGALLQLDWDRTRIAIPMEVPTAEKVMAQIEELRGTPAFEKPNVLFSAGTYYHESGKDLETALEWVSKACELSDRPAYWMFARKARIEVELGKTAAAKVSAEKTLELATAGGNADYQKIARDILAKL
ncbi:DUF2911 domain-containing protein [Pelagicoccus sp. NFK12]|uniref:DUF2911 domain-containing protein n=1 Tax=Pelagicoccus enzymogenes TaxID=2773457 RepID=A0A927FD40_9BACT|nr:DUF2911 domain-containing protein [Pelagicoccus enzymogenes]MBD5782155.1 DUF2911 domain-containing protein [Pelagicoccus enzymogenes]MDQ8196908.1 DUF2911 domain-containing protein [Pelagicoccus enzymogenes]